MLSIWTVFDHPRDFPHCFVARRFEGERATGDVIVCRDLEPLRDEMERRGLVKIDRFPEDHPNVVESWL